MRNRKFYLLIISLILLSAIAMSGCNQSDESADKSDAKSGSPEMAAGETEIVGSEIKNVRELSVTSEGLVASMYDGEISWSPDGEYIALGMSNQTLASAQTQIIDIESGERKAVVGGYNLFWDPEDSFRVIFSRHQYYGPPDYGSFEETVSVDQAELFANETFNEEMSYRALSIDEIQIGDSELPADVLKSSAWGDGGEFLIKSTDGRPSLFRKDKDGNMELMVAEDVIVDNFCLSPDGDRIIYRQIAGKLDELGNWEANDANTTFFVADLEYSN